MPAGLFFDRYGAQWSLYLGLSFAALGIALECLIAGPLLLLLGGALATVGLTLLLITQPPLFAAVSQEEERTYLYGVAAALGVLGSVMGSAWAGVVPKLLESIVEGNVMPLRLTLLGGCAPAMLAF